MSGRAGKVRKKRVSRSAKAGVVFPVSRVYRYLKLAILKRRVAVGAPIYLSAVLEYLCAEVLELAGNAARDNKKKIITPRHILLAVANDDELHRLLRGVTISQGGVLPHIPEVLLFKKSQLRGVSKPQSLHTKPATTAASKAPKSPVKAAPPKKTTSSPKKSQAASKPTPASGGGITVLSEKTLFLGQKLTVIQGDISQLTVDAVVHPTSGNFSLAGQCGSALRGAGGPSFDSAVKEVSDKTSLAMAEAAISGSGTQLPCKHVLHVHSPSWGDDDAVTNLEKAVKNCLTLAENKNLSTVAFPSVASGSNNFPKQAAAQAILKSIKEYFTSSVSSQLTQIYFVLFDMESIGIYTSELAKLDD
ncbi:Core histone macro-H2A.1 [Geodia barretti]|uniref:Core histone macro-H2A.1 n=2 Tax=Geodia barretti TaxID=519541 RepID=A0AA35W5D7_GEOBA|nr:Core histone macro-H2A.1 [Geodia barretti]